MNKNKKLTITLLIGLISLTAVGCSSKTESEPNKVTDEKIEETDVIFDNSLNESKEELAQGETSEKLDIEKVKAEFKIIENVCINVMAAVTNDVSIATFISEYDLEYTEDSFYMDKEIQLSKKELEKIESESVKKVGYICLDILQQQSDLIKKLGNKEITSEEFDERLDEISSSVSITIFKEMSTLADLALLLDEHSLEFKDVLDYDSVSENAIKLGQTKYSDNISNYIVKALEKSLKS